MDGAFLIFPVAFFLLWWFLRNKGPSAIPTPRPETPEERHRRLAKLVSEVVPDYGEIIEKWPLTIFPASRLPLSKEDMKTVLRMAWTMTDDPTLKRHVSTGYVLLANFRDDIERPIDLTLRLPNLLRPT